MSEFAWAFAIVVLAVLFAGEPDLMDAIVSNYAGGSISCEDGKCVVEVSK